MLIVTVANAGRGPSMVMHIEVDGTICGVCGPSNQSFPVRVDAQERKEFHFPPIHMGFIDPSAMSGKSIQAVVELGSGKEARSNSLLLGQPRRHAIRPKAANPIC